MGYDATSVTEIASLPGAGTISYARTTREPRLLPRFAAVSCPVGVLLVIFEARPDTIINTSSFSHYTPVHVMMMAPLSPLTARGTLTGANEDLYEVLVLEKEKGAVITTVEEETGLCVSLQGSRAEYNLNLDVTPGENHFLSFPLPYPPRHLGDFTLAVLPNRQYISIGHPGTKWHRRLWNRGPQVVLPQNLAAERLDFTFAQVREGFSSPKMIAEVIPKGKSGAHDVSEALVAESDDGFRWRCAFRGPTGPLLGSPILTCEALSNHLK
jgi:hypothetical protein